MPTKLDTVSFKTTLKASGITNLDDAVDTIKKFHLNESIVTLSNGGCTPDGVLIKTKDMPSISDEIIEGIKSINRRG